MDSQVFQIERPERCKTKTLVDLLLPDLLSRMPVSPNFADGRQTLADRFRPDAT